MANNLKSIRNAAPDDFLPVFQALAAGIPDLVSLFDLPWASMLASDLEPPLPRLGIDLGTELSYLLWYACHLEDDDSMAPATHVGDPETREPPEEQPLSFSFDHAFNKQ